MNKSEKFLKTKDLTPQVRKLEPSELVNVAGGVDFLTTICPYKNDGDICTGSPYNCGNTYEKRIEEAGYCSFG
jgi:hypothetical protein